MRMFAKALRPLSAHLFAVMVVAALAVMNGERRLYPAVRATFHERFRFVQAELPEPVGGVTKQIRRVHPSLSRFAGWISSVGAAVSLADLDGNGLPDDFC